jgi:hypothetical protein
MTGVRRRMPREMYRCPILRRHSNREWSIVSQGVDPGRLLATVLGRYRLISSAPTENAALSPPHVRTIHRTDRHPRTVMGFLYSRDLSPTFTPTTPLNSSADQGRPNLIYVDGGKASGCTAHKSVSSETGDIIINTAHGTCDSRSSEGRVGLTGERTSLTSRGVEACAMTIILTHGSPFRRRRSEGGEAGMDDRHADANDVDLRDPLRLCAAARAMREALDSTGGMPSTR